MKKRIASLLAALALCLTMLPMAAFAEDTVSAAQSSRTVITTVDELMQFAADVNAGKYTDPNAVVSLESDLDLSGIDWTPIGGALDAKGFIICFNGKFYGNGHTISNIDFSKVYSEKECGGFFGGIENAALYDLTVQGTATAAQSGHHTFFGVITGVAGNATISGCVSDISFQSNGNTLVGGLGLCGYAEDSTIEYCQSKGHISITGSQAGLYVGGIAGSANGSSNIRYCTNSTDMEVYASYTGGIVGYVCNTSSVTNCYSVGKLTALGTPAENNIGGIIGYINGNAGNATVTHCYFAGEIDLTKYGVTAPPYNRLGGLVGKVESGTPVFKNNYYTETENVASCGTSTFTAGTAESIDSMKTQEFYDKLTQNGGGYRFNQNGTPLLPGPKYTVTFTVSPAELPNVVITVNGQALTNGSIDLEAGTYPVTVTADNCEPFSADITITADTATHAQTLTLTYKPADYTAVDAVIAKAGALNRDDYTDFSAVDAAINAVDRSKNITQQADVDAMAKAIEGALAALVVKPTATPAPTAAPTPAPAAPAATAEPQPTATAAPTATPAPVVTATPQPPVTIPQTSDGMNVTLLFALALCSGAALGLAAHKKNRS